LFEVVGAATTSNNKKEEKYRTAVGKIVALAWPGR
jgi:hypothetical protein